ncbi:MAG TPA: dienelactone hydrolase family protein [Lichenihabitans sp.]|jgi:carboxymethylenebutenolidase|nr:dienelactone hydrolase family protein [Lichenihabitans sp.]
MSEMIKLTPSDGVSIGAYKAVPAGTPRGGIVVLQEIFGVNSHIRRVTDGFAAEGYLAIAPALFDRVKPGVELGYTPDDIQAGMALVGQGDQAKTLLDIEAAIEAAREGGKVGIVGFCWGGSMAFAAAAKLDGLSAAVGYYGGNIAKMLDLKPKVPTILHFGELDAHIPKSDVDKIKAALPDVPVYTYKADHGFNCDARGSYDKASAAEAMGRTLDVFSKHLRR